jgi:hypothetical protein
VLEIQGQGLVFRRYFSVQLTLKFLGIGCVDTTAKRPYQDFLFPLEMSVDSPLPFLPREIPARRSLRFRSHLVRLEY